MSQQKFTIAPKTHINGSSKLLKGRRVFLDGGVLRYASSTELEVGILTSTALPNEHACVQPLYAYGEFLFVSSGAIGTGVSVYRADNGKVGPAGTSELGRSLSSTSADNYFISCSVAAAAVGGAGVNRMIGLEDLGDVSGAASVDFTTGSSNNKKVNVIGAVTSWSFTWGSAGYYQWFIRQQTGGTSIAPPSTDDIVGNFLVDDRTGYTTKVGLFWDGFKGHIQHITTSHNEE